MQTVPLSARLWLGVGLLPLLLAAFIALMVATGGGKGEAPMILFFAALWLIAIAAACTVAWRLSAGRESQRGG